MRLHRLEIEGFGPFRDRQVVDFDAFESDGIFLIAGRTGAGKSSVLDAVCFGLYGGVPRYESGDKRLRSDHCEPDDRTEVAVEFTSAGSRWRVTRSPDYERPKKRGDGFTTVASEAQLFELVDGEWIGRASGARNVGIELDGILGLSQKQFLQVILLAQGRFQQFLLAKNDERQGLLRTLFGTRRWEDLQKSLDERRKLSGGELAGGRDRLAHRLRDAEELVAEHSFGGEHPAEADALDEVRVAALEADEQRAAYRLERAQGERDEAQSAHDSAQAAHSALVERRRRQTERDSARLRLAELEAQAPAIAADAAALAGALRAEALRPSLDAVREAEREAAEAAAEQDAAQLGWTQTTGPDGAEAAPGSDADALVALVERLTRELGGWSEAAELEKALPQRREEHARAVADAAERAQELESHEARWSVLPTELVAVEEALAATLALAAPLPSARAHVSALLQQLEAAREAAALEDAARLAAERRLAAAHELRAAVDGHTTLLERRLRGHAGELAAALVDGEPCLVCGALEHPHPAVAAEEPVTDEALATAEDRKALAVAADLVAAAQEAEARTALAAARERAGGETVVTLEQARSLAEASVAAAEASAQRVAELTAEREALSAERDALAAAREGAQAALARARETLAVATQSVDDARARIDAARGPHATVAERIALTTERRNAAATLAAARERLAEAERRLRRATADRDARLTESDFADAVAAQAALLPSGDRERLDARIRRHDADLTSERERLLELELEALPEEPIDLTAAAEVVERARLRWTDAVAAAERTAAAVATLRRLRAEITGLHSEIAEKTAAHAVVARLANTVAGRAPNTHRMTLEAFILAAELEEIVTAANVRLAEMSSGRYRLQHSDALAARGAASGLGLEVLDAFTGQARPPQSLSGGETFLASLSLALGLAEVVTARAGGIRLDTLFIDEGFGSLDPDTLEVAMRVLDELRQGGRTVGVISHVEAMKEALTAQLTVEATPQGPSVIRQDSLVGQARQTP